MNNFNEFADYYDLLYSDKLYSSEFAWINKILLEQIRPNSASKPRLLSVGCGTGRFEALFAQQGWNVVGVDRSEAMLRHARRRADLLSFDSQELSFIAADIVKMKLSSTFDCAVALFHVLNYLSDSTSLVAGLTCIGNHLPHGAPLLFDTWHAPGVVADPPKVRVKRIRDSNFMLTRIAEPTHRPEAAVVDVAYTIFAKNINTGEITEHYEKHCMHYLSPEGIYDACKISGFDPPRMLLIPADHDESHSAPWSVYWITVKS